jgi:hypothetical protein
MLTPDSILIVAPQMLEFVVAGGDPSPHPDVRILTAQKLVQVARLRSMPKPPPLPW